MLRTASEDHLAQCIELMGKFPKKLALTGEYARNFFNRRGELKHIQSLKPWPLREVFRDKYSFADEAADGVAAFLGMCLEINPARRGTAEECLREPWVNPTVE